ncbi:hypothetical protein RhiirC2_782997 [Rhizophagus irregularis]|uniref:F-box domain-containing protein n=1 Tax=Rhizophagus irregularis TaxID=588596 RepID=A0A2N1N1V5_9GLOM|nr:hypothetical protein RhiirC2_782997 [Rhizophagus irregularis]
MLDQLPVEIVECIVAKIPDTDLIAATIGKQFEKRDIDWITFENEWDGHRSLEKANYRVCIK